MSRIYWKLLLLLKSQECQSIVTPDGIYTFTCVNHGATNAVTHLESLLTSIIPEKLKPNVPIWLHDILIHEETVKKLQECIIAFFCLCMDFNIKLHRAKCVLFSTKICWCGRLISVNGIRNDPHRLTALLSMETPATGAHLQKVLCALQWVKQDMLDFTSLVKPHPKFMELVYATAGKRTKTAFNRIILVDYGWIETEKKSFESCKKALTHQVTLSHRNLSQRLCVYTDALHRAWSGIITQVPHNDVSLPHVELCHSPLSFLSGRFNATQLGWSFLEKEALAVLNILDRMH